MGKNIWQCWGQFKWTTLIWYLCSSTPFSLYLTAWKKNKTSQFKRWKCRMAFSMEVNAAVGLFGLIPLGFSLQEHPSDQTPLQRQGGRRGDQQMTLSGCDKVAEILPAASYRAPAACEHSQDRGNGTVTECAASVCPTEQGKKCIKKALRSNRKGNFKAQQFRHCWPPCGFWSLAKVEELSPSLRGTLGCVSPPSHTQKSGLWDLQSDWFWHGTDVVNISLRSKCQSSWQALQPRTLPSNLGNTRLGLTQLETC